MENVKKLFGIRNKIIKAFEDGTFPLSKEQAEKEEEQTGKKEKTSPNWMLVK